MEPRSSALEVVDPWSEIAHDLKGPLTSILINAELMAREAHGSLGERVADILTAASWMQRMMAAFSELRRAEAGELYLLPARFDLREALEDACERVASQIAARGQRLVVTADLAAPWIVSDRQVVTRVIENAIDHCHRTAGPGAELLVRAGEPDPHMVEVELAVRASVHAMRAGRGVGFAYCHHAARALGGVLEVAEHGLIVRWPRRSR
jgi:signal transduction histidine kinase